MNGAVLTIDLTAIASNARRFGATSPGFMAVVKADGFGHGAADVARTALAHGASRLGVTGIGEALELRADGITAPILSWLNTIDADFSTAVAADVELAVNGVELLDRVSEAASAVNRTARVHLFADTGMNREGASPTDWPRLCRRAATLERRGTVAVSGIMSHLACAHDPTHPANVEALARFDKATRVARDRGLSPSLRHIAATAATLDIPDARFDLVRVGAGLYGIDPARRNRLRHALTLTAPVATVRDVPRGTAVGYGHSHSVASETRLALLPLGYADGIPPSAANTAQVQVSGRRCPIVGAVSMDQIVIDVGDLPVRVGDTATVFGPGGNGEPTMTEWADWCHTIEHELMTRLGSRITRRTRPVHPSNRPARHGGRVNTVNRTEGRHDSLC